MPMVSDGRRGSTRIGRKILAVLVLAGLVVAGVVYYKDFEWYAPEISLELPNDAIGLRPFVVKVVDRGTGVREVSVELVGAKGTLALASATPADHPGSFELTVPVEPLRKQLTEGAATLRIAAADHSRWNFLRGNRTTLERAVQVDLTPPTLGVLSRQHYVNRGGSGMVAYRVSPDTVRSGVRIGSYFFPGYPVAGSEPGAHVALFAHPHDLPASERPMVEAEDAAGNQARAGFFYSLKDRNYRKREITVSDAFIDAKIIPLLGAHAEGDRAAMYRRVNEEMRADNARTIREVCAETAPSPLWEGAFQQLTNSKVEANFADERTYIYNGKPVSHAFHLGFDLAVTRHYPVEAANTGKVVFAGNLGIYGNTVILDHGLGLHTLYAHLSSIDVKVGQTVKKRATLGRSGETGLAAGDHLHYGVLVNGTPVLPVEWWDGHWIEDNVDDKLAAARGTAH